MSLNLLDFVVLALAVFRLSYMLVSEDGPFEMFNGLRWLVGTRWVYPEEPTEPAFKTSWFDQHWPDKPYWLLAIVKTPYGILDCIFCCSVWVGIGFTLLYLISAQAAVVVALPFAFSAITIAIREKLVL